MFKVMRVGLITCVRWLTGKSASRRPPLRRMCCTLSKADVTRGKECCGMCTHVCTHHALKNCANGSASVYTATSKSSQDKHRSRTASAKTCRVRRSCFTCSFTSPAMPTERTVNLLAATNVRATRCRKHICFPLLSVRVSASCTELSTLFKGNLFGQLFCQSLAQNLGKHPGPSNFGSHGGTHLQRYGDFTYSVALPVLVALPLFFFTPSPNPLNCVPASPESPSNQW